MRSEVRRGTVTGGATLACLAALLSVPTVATAASSAPVAAGDQLATTISPMLAQAAPGHGSRLVPDKPRANTPRISNGEIWDIEVIPQLNRVFVAGSFSSLANTVAPTTTVNQSLLASYNLNTGLIDTSFRPTLAAAGSAPSRRRPTAPSSSWRDRSTPSAEWPSRK